jgi:predicted MFS family arabinose efflux permease|tara:strand:+ start:175729 stop:176937 length:1209 start_codon:yes stop_codon:yes gene_type:complete
MSDLRLERKIVWLAALIQLANILDFMIILPLGPDLTTAINIPSSDMGMLGGIYTFAAAISGILIAPYLDRFDRKTAAIIFLLGLAISTFLCIFAFDTYSMLAARMLAGVFGGPVTAISLAMVIDMVPLARRGRAIALVTSAFTVSSVFGIPLALELAGLFDWKMPFIVIGGFSALVAFGIFILLPNMTSHMDRTEKKPKRTPIFRILKKTEVQLAYVLLSLMSFAQFMLFSGTIVYFTFNLGFPREDLGSIYFAAGLLSFAAMMMTGRVIDLYGARLLSRIITVVYVLVLADGFLHEPLMPVPAIFCLFMMCAAIMGVICSTISSEVPGEKERAAYMSLQSTARHLAAGAGGLAASLILTSDESGRLDNIEYLAAVSILCLAALPLVIVILRRVLNLKQDVA